MARVRSEQAGQLLADMLRRCSGRSFNLVGHSLGARVIFYALSELASAARATNSFAKAARIVNVHLLGGAVGVDEDWATALGRIEGQCYSYFSTNDSVLKYLYPLGVLFQSKPIGRYPIQTISATSRIRSVDVSEMIKAHDLYHSYLSAVLQSEQTRRSRFWRRLFISD
jgi:esterase/lipase superfamily enzyme